MSVDQWGDVLHPITREGVNKQQLCKRTQTFRKRLLFALRSWHMMSIGITLGRAFARKLWKR